jgi:hypothetical protein
MDMLDAEFTAAELETGVEDLLAALPLDAPPIAR